MERKTQQRARKKNWFSIRFFRELVRAWEALPSGRIRCGPFSAAPHGSLVDSHRIGQEEEKNKTEILLQGIPSSSARLASVENRSHLLPEFLFRLRYIYIYIYISCVVVVIPEDKVIPAALLCSRRKQTEAHKSSFFFFWVPPFRRGTKWWIWRCWEPIVRLALSLSISRKRTWCSICSISQPIESKAEFFSSFFSFFFFCL